MIDVWGWTLFLLLFGCLVGAYWRYLQTVGMEKDSPSKADRLNDDSDER